VKAAEKAALEADGALRRQKAEAEVQPRRRRSGRHWPKSKRELLGEDLKSLSAGDLIFRLIARSCPRLRA
jgi:hypothetical protein